jgi:formate dehydrogenase major subunit
MNVQFSRRQFLKGTGAGVAGSAIGAFGFGGAEVALAQAAQAFKLSKATETRNTCPYCSVSCGMILYSRGDVKKGEKAEIFHIEGDVDNPVNRGTLCPKGAGVLDFIHSKQRVTRPMHRKPGADRFEPVSWDFAMERIAKLMKEDRDANFIEKTRDGVTVNRWPTMGFLAGCATSNEAGWLTWKTVRGLGIVQVDNQARI